MSEIEESDTPGRLGTGFWALWSAGIIALVTGFALAAYFIVTRFHSAYAMGVAIFAFTLSFAGISMLPYAMRRRRGLEGPIRLPQRRYMLRFLPPMMAYCVALPSAITAYRAFTPTGVGACLIALAPTIPLLFAVRALLLLHNEEDDEYQRGKTAYVFTWATCLTLAMCTIFGFLEMFKLAPKVDLWIVFPMWALCLFPAQLLAWRKFG